LALCLRKEQQFNIIECDNTFYQVEDILSKQPVDLIISHINGTNHLQKLGNIIRTDTSRKVVVAGESDREIIFEYIKVGVKGHLDNNISPELLKRAIRVLHDGEAWFDRDISSRVVDWFSDHGAVARQSKQNTSLSKREMEVLECVSRGMKNRGIAQALHISESTVKTHLYRIYEKLDVKDRMSAVLKMHQW